ncbi:cell division protein CrgA [Phycicoccus flavus]|uniref:cell division protein CrgA n=1 Tax=Phycicoccus flavus TaxID=2502783 RepID=UPI000FEC047F|nr:cell division protein CrgA [Phycicoccus flavus]NHA69351.1 cell division protein CrgA [Phycicoccus flavus]
MPESKGRSKATYTPPPRAKAADKGPNPRWFVPVMLGLMVLGLLWVVTFYITQQQFPVESLGRWNLGIGFGLMLTGFMMTTRWR